MVLCWRLPDNRRWLAIVVELVVLFCGVGLVHLKLESARENGSVAILNRIHESPVYLGLLADLASERSHKESLSARLRATPSDHITVAANLSKEISGQSAKISSLSMKLAELEASIPGDPVTVASAFEVFGVGSSGTTELIVLVLLALGNEAIALSLQFRRRNPDESAQMNAPVNADSITPEEYAQFATAFAVGATPAGYRKMAEKLDISAYRARQLYQEAVSKDLLQGVNHG